MSCRALEAVLRRSLSEAVALVPVSMPDPEELGLAPAVDVPGDLPGLGEGGTDEVAA